MAGCRNNFLDLLLRLGFGFIILGVIVLAMAFFGSNPQTAEEVTGSTVNIYEMVYLFVSMFTANPLSAGVLMLATGIILIIIVMLINTFNEAPSTNKRQHRG